MTKNEELAYERGQRQAWVNLLRHCCRELGYGDVESQRVLWIAEREAAVAMLRIVCDTHGDNDWPDNLHLADVIDKHLSDHLEAPDEA